MTFLCLQHRREDRRFLGNGKYLKETFGAIIKRIINTKRNTDYKQYTGI